MNKVSELEMVLELRKKFELSSEEQEKWSRYHKLGARDNLSEEQQAFVDAYSEIIHNEEEDIKLTKKEFKWIAGKVTSDDVRLPSNPALIEKSIAFVQKLKEKNEEEDKI